MQIMHDMKNQLKKIAKLLAEGDKKALNQFYGLYGKTIYIIARSVCRMHESADKVVNDVLIKVWNMAEFFTEIENPAGWIYTVTVNAAKDKLKQKQWQPLLEDVIDSRDGYRKIEDNDRFYYMIRELNGAEQAIIIFKIIEDLTFEEIADITAKPLSTITSTYYRALDKIKKTI